MDDIFFNDQPNRPKSSPPQPDKFRSDLFSDAPAEESPKKFVVHLPQDVQQTPVTPDPPATPPTAPRDRTPKGRPIDGGEATVPQRERPVVSGRRTSPIVTTEVPAYTPTPEETRQSQLTAQQAAIDARAREARSPSPQRSPAAAQTQRTQTAAKRTPPRRPKKNRHTGAKIVAFLLILVLLVGLGTAAYGYIAVGKLNFDREFDPSNPYISQSELMQSPTVKNILFIGSDARGDVEGQRSDTMLICSIDTLHHKVKLTSLLRDTYVYIPAKGYHTKLNAAFSYGGANMLVDTVEYNFKVKIDDYVMIDFEGFVKLIDAMGGLDVDGVTEPEARYLRDVVKILYAKEGKNHFSGKASLWYCRIRKLDDDFHRTERQRKVIHAILHQALGKGPFKLMGIINEVLPYISTSMDRNEVVATAAGAVFNFIGGENPQHQVPAEDTWSNATVNGAAVLKFDEEKNVALLKEFIFE